MRESRRLTFLHVLCATLSLARDTSWQSRCGQTCRKDSAKLLPSVVVPLPSRLANASTSNLAPKPQLYVAMTTIPPRMTKRHLKQAVDTVLAQTRPPDKVLVSASRKYARFPGPIPDLSSILPSNHKLVETITCEVDMGPATKLLCALPRLRELTKSSAGAGSAWAVLMDDDLRYWPCICRPSPIGRRLRAPGALIAMATATAQTGLLRRARTKARRTRRRRPCIYSRQAIVRALAAVRARTAARSKREGVRPAASEGFLVRRRVVRRRKGDAGEGDCGGRAG